jgi:hypothetical protein
MDLMGSLLDLPMTSSPVSATPFAQPTQTGVLDLDSFFAKEASKVGARRSTSDEKSTARIESFFSSLSMHPEGQSQPLPVVNVQELAGLEAFGESLLAEKKQQAIASTGLFAASAQQPSQQPSQQHDQSSAPASDTDFMVFVNQLPDISFMLAKTLVVPASKYKIAL